MDKPHIYPASFPAVAVLAATAVFGFITVISLTLPNLEPFMAIFLTGVVFLGIPHGALDIFLLRKLTRTRKELRSLIGTYLLAVGLVAGTWILVPEGAFLFFIGYSCFHFALSDLSRRPPSRGTMNSVSLEFLARFMTPFFVPFGLQPERAIALARMVQSGEVFESLLPAISALAYAAILLCAAVAVVELYQFVYRRKEWRIISLEPLVICFLFYYLDPLYSFGIYFCFVHSVKHILTFLTSPIKVNLSELLPYWLIPVLGIFIFVWATMSAETRITSGLFRWSILVISAIAFPHTLLVYMGKKTGHLSY